MDFLIDLLCFLVAPVVCWRALRGIIPMAVTPILAGLGIAVAAYHVDFDKSLLGPSALGETIGWIGVLVLVYSAGLETRTMAGGPRMAGQLVGSAANALALPFAAGFLIILSGVADAVVVPPASAQPLFFAAAVGLCLAVSALPVLVGLVRELPLPDRPIGNLALRIAALDDAILWSGLALLLFLFGGKAGGLLATDWHDGAALALFAAMALLRRPLDRLLPTHPVFCVVLGAAYLCAGAWATTVLGLHEILGAYFAGALAPAGVAARLKPELLGKVALFGLSPLYFAHRGLSIDGSVLTLAALGFALLLLVAGVATKLLAVYVTPPDRNMSLTDRTRLGLLLQCKGLMEIVAASILLQGGLLSEEAFAILVTLAIVSTTLTIPMFRLTSNSVTAREIQTAGDS